MADRAPHHDETIGASIAGRYRIISRLGAGGMGVAYRAWDERRGVPVVIKIPKRAFLDDPTFAERFARETRLLQGLDHPSIVPLEDLGEYDGLPYVVLRFLPGGSLSNRRMRDAQGKPLPNAAGMLHLWLPAIAAALDHVHAQGVVHRDVKPANIFFDAFWGAFLGDFGIAKIIEESDSFDTEQTLTAAHMGIGTQGYMSPEQFMPKAGIDGRSDQYALAVTVYEMLAGQRPFLGKQAHLIVEVTTQPAPTLAGKRSDLPVTLVAAVAKGLAKKPADRFETCAAFAAAVLQDVPVLADDPGLARLLCPKCSNMLKLPVDAAGKSGKCPRCRAKMQVADDLGALWLHAEDRRQLDGGNDPGRIPADDDPAGMVESAAEERDDAGGLGDFRPASGSTPVGRRIRRRSRGPLVAVLGGVAGAVALGAFLLRGGDGGSTPKKPRRPAGISSPLQDEVTIPPRVADEVAATSAPAADKGAAIPAPVADEPAVMPEPAGPEQVVMTPPQPRVAVRREPPPLAARSRAQRMITEAEPPPAQDPPSPPPPDADSPPPADPTPLTAMVDSPAPAAPPAPPAPDPTSPSKDVPEPRQDVAASPLDGAKKPEPAPERKPVRKKPRGKEGPFDGRRNPAERAAEAGGGADTEQAVDRALEWLAAHRLPDGGWSFDLDVCPACNGRCSQSGQTRLADRCAATALAILPFLGRGYTHIKQGKQDSAPYREVVHGALRFLVAPLAAMNSDGRLYNLNDKGDMYSHGVAAIALGEAYALTRDRDLGVAVQRAISFIMNAQDQQGGGWRYHPQQPGDTSASGWQLMALSTAVAGKLPVNPLTINKAAGFLNAVQSANGAMYGYDQPGKGPATTAVGLLCRMQMGWDRNHPAVQRGVAHLGEMGPSNDLYYDYYATQVMYQHGGDPWVRWNDAMKPILLLSQSQAGHESGSFYGGVDGGHGPPAGGRLYCTAMATLILEVYYRHLRMNP